MFHWRTHGAQKEKPHECHIEQTDVGINLHFYTVIFIHKTSKKFLQFDSQAHAHTDHNLVI